MGRKPSGIRPFSLRHSSLCPQKKGERLREPRKCHEKLFGVCAGRASSAAFTETFAQAAQVPPHLPRRLRRLRKFRRICRDVCAGCASSAAFTEVFAGVPQVSRETFWRLRKLRKGHFLHFDACGSSANATKKRSAGHTPGERASPHSMYPAHLASGAVGA